MVLIAKAYEDGYSKELTLLVDNGIVIKRFNFVDKSLCNHYKCIDLRNRGILLPGFIDIHVHLRGLELSYKEDEESGTKAALKGGFTAVVDMPNTIPRINNLGSLQLKIDSLKVKGYVDYGLYVSPAEEKELRSMILRDGVVGVKIFPQDLPWLSAVVKVLREVENKVLIVHAEHPLLVNECDAGFRSLCRPIESEIAVINMISKHLDKHIRVHITHATNVLTVVLSKKYTFTVDTCPHYLYLDSSYEEKLGCLAKVNPPLRAISTKTSLLKYLKYIDAISSDHAPHSIDEKLQEFNECPSGIASIEYVAPLVLNLVDKGIIELDDVIRLLSKGPAKILGLYKWGCLYEGCIASYTVVDLKERIKIDDLYFSKSRLTPYKGMDIAGAIKATIVRGYLAYVDGDLYEKPTPKPLTNFVKVGGIHA